MNYYGYYIYNNVPLDVEKGNIYTNDTDYIYNNFGRRFENERGNNHCVNC